MQGKTRSFATDGLRLTFEAAGEAGGLRLAALELLPEGLPLLPRRQPAELAELVLGNPSAAGNWRNAVVLALGTLVTSAPERAPGLPTSALGVTALHGEPDGAAMIAELAAEDSGLRVRCTVAAARGGALRMTLQARLAGKELPLDCTLRLPWLRALHPGAPAPAHTELPEGPRLEDARPIVRAGQFPLPYAVWSTEAPQHGLAVLSRRAASTQVMPAWIPVPRTGLAVRLRDEWLDLIELLLVPFRNGWPGAFAAMRNQMRARLDLRDYGRSDLAWYRYQWVQHFTFAYGREVYDFARGQFDIQRLLDEGERDFGGYDGMLLWPQYPRIGLDQRSQWDFFDDLPGGRAGIAALARQARARGTRFFIPYLPWDDPADERRTHRNLPAAALAQVVRDCDVDGVFLDTMSSVLPAFRTAIDAVRPGVVFCSEGRPREEALELITGSWAQDRIDQALEVDLQRFLLPEHPTFVIFRHSIRKARRQVLLRALFNGTGLVVWQDIFGEVLPFTPAERALVKRIAGVLRGHAALFRGADALPLVPSLQAGLYANLFAGHNGRRALSVWNATNAALEGDLLVLPAPGHRNRGVTFADVWNGGTLHARQEAHGRQVLSGTVPPESAVLVEDGQRAIAGG